MNLLVFEDDAWQNFRQIAYVRPVYRLMTPQGPILERIRRGLQTSETFAYIRDYLAGVERERDPSLRINTEPRSDEEAVIVNGLTRRFDIVFRLVEKAAGREFILLAGDRVCAARLRGHRVRGVEDSNMLNGRLKSLVGEVEALEAPPDSVFSYPWELLDDEPPALTAQQPFQPDTHVAVLGNPANISIPPSCEIEPFTVIDARRGPVILGENVRVESNSKLIGPCVIGRDSIVYGGRVGPSLYTGPTCRISAEIENTIMLGYSNKHHYGYIGHTTIGEWVNIAAGTTTSNLKTTYGEIKVRLDGRVIHTGRQFLGSVMGDHVRTMIDTTLMTGRLAGPFAVLSGVVVKNIPPFTGIDFSREMYELELEPELRALERMMKRRGLSPSNAYKELVKRLHELTRSERTGVMGHRSDHP